MTEDNQENKIKYSIWNTRTNENLEASNPHFTKLRKQSNIKSHITGKNE